MVREPPEAVLKQSLTKKARDLVGGWLSLRGAEKEFQKTLADWSLGGPKAGGWTRTGPPIGVPGCTLAWPRRGVVEAHDCFAKNRPEMARWHLAFLETYLSGGDLEGSAYWREYLLTRLSREAAAQKSARFVALFESLAADGRHHGRRVWLADLASIRGLPRHFGFRYFRFDGAHRLACLYTLGIRQIPCLVFPLRPSR